MKNRLRQELEAMLGLHTGDPFTADNVHTLVNGIFAVDEVGGGFEYVEYDNNAFRYPQTIGKTADSISGLGPADESMIDTIFIMPNKETDSTATLMIVVDEVTPETNPKTYQYIYVGNINDLPSDVLTEGSIVNDLSTGGTDKPLSAEQGRILNSHVNYTTCGSNAEDQVKLISDDGFELNTHLRLLVMMTNTNTHATPKFNINNTGIKDVWYNGAVASDTNTWSAGEVLDVYYDGTKYIATTYGGDQFATGEKVKNVGIDSEPTAGSDNLVKSGGVKNYVDGLVSDYNISQHQVNTTAPQDSTRYNTNIFTLEEAINQIPSQYRHSGLKLTFNSEEGVENWILSKNQYSTILSDWVLLNNPTINEIEYVGFGNIQLNQGQTGISSPLILNKKFKAGTNVKISLIGDSGVLSTENNVIYLKYPSEYVLVSDGNSINHILENDIEFIYFYFSSSSSVLSTGNVKVTVESLDTLKNEVRELSNKLSGEVTRLETIIPTISNNIDDILLTIPLFRPNDKYLVGNQMRIVENSITKYYRCTTEYVSGDSVDLTKFTEITQTFTLSSATTEKFTVNNITKDFHQLIVNLDYIGKNFAGIISIGDIAYDTYDRLIYRKTKNYSPYFTEVVPYILGAIYHYKGIYYHWNGAELVSITEKLDNIADLIEYIGTGSIKLNQGQTGATTPILLSKSFKANDKVKISIKGDTGVLSSDGVVIYLKYPSEYVILKDGESVEHTLINNVSDIILYIGSSAVVLSTGNVTVSIESLTTIKYKVASLDTEVPRLESEINEVNNNIYDRVFEYTDNHYFEFSFESNKRYLVTNLRNYPSANDFKLYDNITDKNQIGSTISMPYRCTCIISNTTAGCFYITSGTIAITDLDSIAGQLLTSEKKYPLSISMLDNIAVCGDSFAEGSYANQGINKASWGKILGRIIGANVAIYAQGGATTKTYQTASPCLPKLLSEPAHELYILNLGINDISGTLGTISDIHDSDYTQNPDTFYGNYGRIIQQIKNHAPNAFLVIMKTLNPFYQNGSYYDWSSSAIEEIAEHYNIPFLDTKDSYYIVSKEYNDNMYNAHPTPPQYSGIAKSVEELLSKSMYENINYWKNYNADPVSQ